jgi:hypothetical protein
MGFQGGQVNLCLMMKTSSKGLAFIAIYMDDCLIVVDDEAIKDAIKGLKTHDFTLKDDGTLMDYLLSCEVSFAKNGKHKHGFINHILSRRWKSNC